jgi:hypothetical protein
MNVPLAGRFYFFLLVEGNGLSGLDLFIVENVFGFTSDCLPHSPLQFDVKAKPCDRRFGC